MALSKFRLTSADSQNASGLSQSCHLDLVSALLTADWERARHNLTDFPLIPADLMDWLRRNHLAGQFAAIINDSPLHDSFPKSLLDKAGQHLLNQTRHNAKVRIATRKAVQCLKNFGISSILLKGIHYALRFQGGLDQRFLWDVDLLLQDKDREAAIACLLDQGYRVQTNKLWNNRFTRGMVHAISLHDGEVELDLHWHLRNRPAYRIDYDNLWFSRQEYCIGDTCFDVPGDDYTLLTLLLGLAHDLEAGHFKLKHLFDLHCMLSVLEPTMNWEGFFKDRETERLAGLSLNVLAFYHLIFDSVSETPRLAAAMDQRPETIRVNDIDEARRLAEGARQNLHNRRWYASVYPGGAFNYVLWWTSTVPLRFAIGRSV